MIISFRNPLEDVPSAVVQGVFILNIKKGQPRLPLKILYIIVQQR